LLLDRGHSFAQEGGVEIIQEGLDLVEIPQLAYLLTDLRTGCCKRSGTAITASIAWTTAVCHIDSMYRRYIVNTISKITILRYVPKCALPNDILVSPFMNFNVQAKTTDIMMFNSRNLGALIVDKKPHVREWDEPQFDIKNIGIEESYLSSAC
jgi:hypothetical protein